MYRSKSKIKKKLKSIFDQLTWEMGDPYEIRIFLSQKYGFIYI